VLRATVGVALSGGIIAALLWKADWAEVRAVFEQVSWWRVAPLPLIYLASFPLRGLRWQLMLRPLGKVPLARSTAIVAVGYMANNLLPARLGEFVRAGVLRQSEGISGVSAFTSIVTERVFDGLTLAAILVWTMQGLPADASYADHLDRLAYAVSMGFSAALLAILLARLLPRQIRRATSWLTAWLPERMRSRLDRAVDSALSSVTFLRSGGAVLAVAGLSATVWLFEGAMFWCGLWAFGLPADLRLALFTLAVVNFGALLPSAPGYVGVFQAGALVAFAAHGLGVELALGYSITVPAMQFIPITLVGAVVLTRLGLSLKSLRHLGRSHRPKTTDPTEPSSSDG
jgi:uncharacterized protein (TIRG00374 family)